MPPSARSPLSVAMVAYASAREADRRVAGVAVAARVLRELSRAGVREAWLLLPVGAGLDDLAHDDVERLRGAMHVRIVTSPEMAGWDMDGVALVSGTRLVPSAIIADFLKNGRQVIDGQGRSLLRRHEGSEESASQAVPPLEYLDAIALDEPTADAAILKQTDKKSDGPVSRYLNRPVSRFLSALLLRYPAMRPNHATIGTAALAAAMFLALLLGGGAGLVLGGLLFHAASVFDGVDGEMARASFRTSPAGAALDSVVDLATNMLFILGVTINLSLHAHPGFALIGAWGLALFICGASIVAYRVRRSRNPLHFDLVKQDYRDRYTSGFIPFIVRFLTVVMSRDFFAFLFMLLILAGLAEAILYIFSAAATVWFVLILGSIAAAMMPPRPALGPGRG